MYDVDQGFKVINHFARNSDIPAIAVKEGINDNIDITIAIPTFKRSLTLIDTIDSIIKQKETIRYKCEILIVDNDPTRSCPTENLIKTQYLKQENLRYFKNSQNIGAFGNWNRCFELARGKWVILLHDDDFAYAELLTEVEAILYQHPDIGILKPAIETWRDVGRPYVRQMIKEDRKKRFCRVKALDYVFLGNFLGAPTGCVFNREMVISLGGFNPDLYPNADTIFTLFASMHYKVFLYNKTLCVQRLGINDTLKEKTLFQFMYCRYTTISYLIKKYHLEFFLRQQYKNYVITGFYADIKRWWCPDFTYDFSILGHDVYIQNKGLFYKYVIKAYLVMRMVKNRFVKL
ncbi:glycosyltransferase family 2 protein [Bacteroides sp.]|jgi:glycosyltransferase involved in cell wall biosynthesis|uniref:glycosyltransferase family 2 protein n=1 Tax=Bacteroides sp. TaxID=29523 RepID=UPI0025C23ED1|nr:glycosyltransferase family 2 protein [Bacteroides sp.]